MWTSSMCPSTNQSISTQTNQNTCTFANFDALYSSLFFLNKYQSTVDDLIITAIAASEHFIECDSI